MREHVSKTDSHSASQRAPEAAAPLQRGTAPTAAGKALGAFPDLGFRFSRVTISPKLEVGEPNDRYEQEADEIAERVMRMPDPSANRAGDEARDDELPVEQVQREAKGGAPGGMVAPPIVHEVLRSPGQPLDAAMRAFMEPRFGYDFSRVRIHTDTRAEESARAVEARAYTRDAHIVFARGSYTPSTTDGRRLLGHELAHVVQQSGAAARSAPAAAVVQREHEGDVESFGKSSDLTELFPNVQKIRNGALKLLTIGNKLKKKGTGHFWNDKEVLTSAYNILDLSKALLDLANGIDGIRVGTDEEGLGTVTQERVPKLASAGKLATRSRNVVAAVRLVADLIDDDSLRAFEEDPGDFHKASAWATDAAKVFSDAGSLIDVIPDGLMPGIVKEMWKGLLRAPASYVRAFLSIMQAHLDKIDAASGGSGDKARVTGGVGGDWQGPLSLVYFRAPSELRVFMQSHRKTRGLDLFEAPESVGRAQLVAMIEADADPAQKREWIASVEAD